MIETLPEWNTRLGYCGCCPMPVCPGFTIVHAGKYGIGNRCSRDMWNEILDSPIPTCANLRGTWSSRVRRETRTSAGLPTLWSEYTYTVSRSAPLQTCSEGSSLAHSPDGAMTDNYEAFATRTSRSWSGGVLTEVWEYTDDAPDPDVSYTYTIVDTYSGYLSEADALAATINNAVLTADADAWSADSFSSYTFPVAKCVPFLNNFLTATCPDGGDVVTRVDAYKKRFRFRVPVAHTGSKYTFTYDVADFPDDGDPVFVSQDNVVAWTGPGSGAQSDPSWITPWIEIEPPEFLGERRIVNLRYTCYGGTRFGSKPQVMGEALEIPPP